MPGLRRHTWPTRCRSVIEAEDALGVGMEKRVLLDLGEVPDDLRIRVDDVAVRAEQAVERPVRPEERALDAECLDAVQHPWTDRLDRPPMVRHPESGNLHDGVLRP